MPNVLLDTLEILPRTRETNACVIWMHGLGADAQDFQPIVNELELPGNHRIKFIFPNAPIRPITVNGGMKMRGWYDIPSLELSLKEDVVGVESSYTQISDLILRERSNGIVPQRIILAGFSQGGAVALYTGLRYPELLGGILALSAYIPVSRILEKKQNINNIGIPILMIHGLFDPVVSLNIAQKSKYKLQEWGYTVEWKAYPMAHTVCEEEIVLVSKWIKRCLLGENKF